MVKYAVDGEDWRSIMGKELMSARQERYEVCGFSNEELEEYIEVYMYRVTFNDLHTSLHTLYNVPIFKIVYEIYQIIIIIIRSYDI